SRLPPHDFVQAVNSLSSTENTFPVTISKLRTKQTRPPGNFNSRSYRPLGSPTILARSSWSTPSSSPMATLSPYSPEPACDSRRLTTVFVVKFQNCVGFSAATAPTASSAKTPDRISRPMLISSFRAGIRRLTQSLARLPGAAQCALAVAGVVWLAFAASPAAADTLAVKIGVLRQVHSRETISILDIPAPDDFVAGVKMALEDDNTTGRFLDQTYSMVEAKVGASEDPIAKLDKMTAEGVKLFVVDLPADKLLAVADHAKGALIFNAGAPDE